MLKWPPGAWRKPQALSHSLQRGAQLSIYGKLILPLHPAAILVMMPKPCKLDRAGPTHTCGPGWGKEHNLCPPKAGRTSHNRALTQCGKAQFHSLSSSPSVQPCIIYISILQFDTGITALHQCETRLGMQSLRLPVPTLHHPLLWCRWWLLTLCTQ